VKQTVLIVDDEPDLVDVLEFNLQNEGFDTRRAFNGRDGLFLASQAPKPALLILDLMLPDFSGTELCRRLRSNERTRDIPVLMLTARAEEYDRVVGFEVGADDYVTKPFSIRELLLRVRAILRRGETSNEAPAATQNLALGILKIDTSGHRAWVGEDELSLTALEFKLLATLMERAGRVQTRDTLLADVWGMQPGLTTRTVDTHVRRLRVKLGKAEDYVETLRGVGYRLRSDLNA
jgi:two-component system phosphate regulon response regulator PhoB